MLEFSPRTSYAWLCYVKRWVICLQVLLIYILKDIRERLLVGLPGSVIFSLDPWLICEPSKLSENWWSWGFSWKIWPSTWAPFTFYPNKADDYFVHGGIVNDGQNLLRGKACFFFCQFPNFKPIIFHPPNQTELVDNWITLFFDKPDLAGNHGSQREEISYTQPVRLPEQPTGRRRLQTKPRHCYVREQTTMNCVHTEVESDKQQLKCTRDYACKGCAQLLRH